MYKARYGDTLLYDPRSETEQLIDPTVTQQINVADEFNFQQPLNNPVSVLELADEITVLNNDKEFFRGQATNIRDSLGFIKEVTARGELSYFNKSMVPAFDTTTGEDAPNVPSAFFRWILANHNEQSPFKFSEGINQADDLWNGNEFVRSSETPITSGNALKERMLDSLGGYIRIRHENGIRYIDYLSDLPGVTGQGIEFGVNMLDFAKEIDTTDLYTACIPFGEVPEDNDDDEKEKIDLSSIPDGPINTTYMKASGSVGHYIYNIPAVARYGLRMMTKDYNDLSTVDGILNAAMRDVSEVCVPVRTLEISAHDLSVTHPDIEQLTIGNYVPVKCPPLGFSAIMAISKVVNNLSRPSASKYTIGTPKPTLSRGTLARMPELQAGLEESIKATTALTEEQKQQASQIGQLETTVDGLHNTFVYVRYSPNADGADMTVEPQDDTKYMGIVSTDSEVAPTDPGAYTWSYIVGTGGADGVPATNVVVGTSSFTLACNQAGVVKADTIIEIPFSGWTGNDRVGCEASIISKDADIDVVSIVQATEVADGLITLKVTAGKSMHSLDGAVSIELIANAITFQYLVYWSKALDGTQGMDGEPGQDGAPGQPATNVICGNEAASIACGKDGLVSAATQITIPFSGWIGTNRAAASVTVGTLPSGMTVSSNTAATATANGQLVLDVAQGATLGGAGLRNGQVQLTFTCNGLSFVMSFNWSKAIAGSDGEKGADGASGRSFMLDANVEILKTFPDGQSMPESLTFRATETDGETVTPYEGYLVIQTSLDGETWAEYDAVSGSEITILVATLLETVEGVQFVKCQLLSAQNGDLLTARTLSVIADNSSYITKMPDGLYVHELEGDENYNKDGNMRLSTNLIEMRKSGDTLLRVTPQLTELGIGSDSSIIDMCDGMLTVDASTTSSLINLYQGAGRIEADSSYNLYLRGNRSMYLTTGYGVGAEGDSKVAVQAYNSGDIDIFAVGEENQKPFMSFNGGRPFAYSTQEIKTGKTWNGKNIYSRMFIGTLSLPTAYTRASFGLDLPGSTHVIGAEGWFRAATKEVQMNSIWSSQGPGATFNSYFGSNYVIATKQFVAIYMCDEAFTNQPYELKIEYLKD